MFKACRSVVAVLLCVGLQTLAATAQGDSWSGPTSCNCNRSDLSAVTGSSAYPAKVFWQRPTTVYKTSEVRVPVTNYRPVVATDPYTQTSVSTLQPCNTYEVQQRRTATCSLWQRIVNWWRSHRCQWCRRPAATCTPVCETTCGQASEWVISSPASSSTPYYVPSSSNLPSSNGRLVPVPNSSIPPATSSPSRVTPSPVPADRRPQLDPNSSPANRGGEAKSSKDIGEVFVRTLESQDSMVELVPPQISTDSGNDAPAKQQIRSIPQLLPESNIKSAAMDGTPTKLVSISWNVPATRVRREIPTDIVWDDSGWQSER